MLFAYDYYSRTYYILLYMLTKLSIESKSYKEFQLDQVAVQVYYKKRYVHNLEFLASAAWR